MMETWQEKVGNQRDWNWRGWQIHYSFSRPENISKEAPMLMLHGFGASIGHWRNNVSYFAEHRLVYALDLLGFGGSQKAATQYQIKLWVDQVYDFYHTFIKQPMIIVGNSIGSLIALAVATKYPEIVDRLVMISLPDPAFRQEAMPPWLQPTVESVENLFSSPIILRTIFYLVRRPSVVRKWAKIAYFNPQAVNDELVDILTLPALDRHAARAFSGLFRSISDPEFPGVKKMLPKLKIPILLIWGKEDRMIPPRFAKPEQFLQYNPNLQLIQLADAGHCPHDECPERVNQAIMDWIRAGTAGQGSQIAE